MRKSLIAHRNHQAIRIPDCFVPAKGPDGGDKRQFVEVFLPEIVSHMSESLATSPASCLFQLKFRWYKTCKYLKSELRGSIE